MPIRVHKLAKELGVASKDIIAEAMNHGVEVANHMSSLTEAQANLIRAFLQTAPPSAEDKKAAEEAEAEREAKALEEAKAKIARAKAQKAEREAEKAREEEQRISSDATLEHEPPAVERDPETGALRPLSPPDLLGVVARQREAEEEARAAEAAAADEARRAKEERNASAPVLKLGGDIASRVVNPRAPEKSEEEAPSEENAEETTEESPREFKLASPGDSKTVVSKGLDPLGGKKPVKELPQRRGANIVGHKEIRPQQRRPMGRPAGGGGSRPGGPGGPGGPGAGSPGDPPGMIQTKSSGSKRTFVRAPQRGGGGRRFGHGGPSGHGGGRGRGQQGRMQPQRQRKQVEVEPQDCTVELPINIKNLSAAMAVKSGMIIERLLKNHSMFLNINSILDRDTLEIIALEFDVDIKIEDEKDLEKEVVAEEIESFESDAANLEPRPPIVTFLGHVDHGKTSLLDHIRKSRVADREDGGITQHIGAYRVSTDHGDVVFLDTPGHRAFTEMRARGANVTDVVVLIVAANDGVMPQTEEAIAHAKAAGVPIIVAINKCDLPDSKPEQVKQQLSGLGLQPEDWGGDTVTVEVSAKTGAGVDALLEYLSLYTEILELRADPTRPAVGTVIESMQKKGEGNVARIIVTDGSLHRGDNYLVGHVQGKVKAIKLADGKQVKEVGPAWPVEVSGLAELPAAGETFFVVQDLNKAKQLAEERQRALRDQRLGGRGVSGLEGILKQAKTDEINLIVKADTVGSLEVLKKSIMEFEHEEVTPKIIHAAVGGITDTDVTLADASDAVILGFHVTDSGSARRLAEERHVDIQFYTVIYDLLEYVQGAVEGKLKPTLKETITGHLLVKKIFKVSKIGTIAGCIVEDGVIRSTAAARLTRDGVLVYQGKIASLRNVKDDVKEMKEGQECGVRIDGFDDIKVGDVIEPVEIEQIKRTLAD
jgi:translation initiation factor IF-2